MRHCVNTGRERPLPLATKRNAAMWKVLRIRAEPLTADAYRPFGQVIGIDRVRMQIVNDRFHMDTITIEHQPFRISHLHRHLKSTQALIPLGGKACLVVVAPPTVDLHNPADLTQVQAFINDGSCGVNIDLGTWHVPLLPFGSEMNMVSIQGEHVGKDIEQRSFEATFQTVIEVVL